MDAPYLIRKGDSGSWAFDAYTGDLLGILIAGCPKLLEAYILPAYRIFDDIRTKFGRPVGLAGGFYLPAGYQDVHDLLQSREKIEQQIAGIEDTDPLQKWMAINDEIHLWDRNQRSVGELGVPGHGIPNDSPWISPITLKRERGERLVQLLQESIIEEHLAPGHPEGPQLATTPRQSEVPSVGLEEQVTEENLRSHDSLHKDWREFLLRRRGSSDSQLIALNKSWDSFVLGKSGSSIGNIDDMPGYTITEVSKLMDENYVDSGLSHNHYCSPWDRFTLTKALDQMSTELRAAHAEKGLKWRIELGGAFVEGTSRKQRITLGLGCSDLADYLVNSISWKQGARSRSSIWLVDNGYGKEKAAGGVGSWG